jgi:hypothetical protein
MTEQAATLYAVANARYFPGLVGLVNSLRLTGHTHDLVVGDLGLTPDQRNRLRPHCTVVPVPDASAMHPFFWQPFAYLLRPQGTVIVIDSDAIITGPLGPIVSLAEAGQVCAYPDPDDDRWFAEWQRIFGLAEPPRQQSYVASHLVAFSVAHWPDLLERWWQACQRIASEWSRVQRGPDDPIEQADQDALNALLMSEIPPERLALLPARERLTTPGRRSARVLDPQRLTCSYRGHLTRLVHASQPKPWDQASRPHVRRTAYTRLLYRLLNGPDVAVRVDPRELPVWLRPGPVGELSLRTLDAVHASHAWFRRRSRRVRRWWRRIATPARVT